MITNNAALNSLWLCVPAPPLRYVTPTITLALDFASWGLQNEKRAGVGSALAWHADRPVGGGVRLSPSRAGRIPPEAFKGVRCQAVSFKRLGPGPCSSQVPGKCPEVGLRRGNVHHAGSADPLQSSSSRKPPGIWTPNTPDCLCTDLAPVVYPGPLWEAKCTVTENLRCGRRLGLVVTSQCSHPRNPCPPVSSSAWAG